MPSVLPTVQVGAQGRPCQAQNPFWDTQLGGKEVLNTALSSKLGSWSIPGDMWGGLCWMSVYR